MQQRYQRVCTSQWLLHGPQIHVHGFRLGRPRPCPRQRLWSTMAPNLPKCVADQGSEHNSHQGSTAGEEASPSTDALRSEPQASTLAPAAPSWLILDLAMELASGSFWCKSEEALPNPPWGVKEVLKVMQYGIPLSCSLIALQLVPTLLLHPASLDGAVSSAAATQLLDLRDDAGRHLGQEVLLVGASALLLWAALGATQPRSKGMFRFSISPQWAISVALICMVLFPVVDPLIYGAWAQVVREATCSVNPADVMCSSQGGSSMGLNALVLPGQLLPTFATDAIVDPAVGSLAPVTSAAFIPRPFKDTVLSCVSSQDYISLGMHMAASCLLGPLWEETFWRGFILPSIASKLPKQLPLAVACSSLNFATLHLSITSGLPILVLSSACDMLYLRSGSIGPPLMLHAAWNAYQLVGVGFFGKESFV